MSNFCHKANGLVAIFNRRSQIQRTNLPLLYRKQNRRGSLKSGTDHHYTNQHISHFPHTHYYMYNLCHHNMKCTCTHCFFIPLSPAQYSANLHCEKPISHQDIRTPVISRDARSHERPTQLPPNQSYQQYPPPNMG